MKRHSDFVGELAEISNNPYEDHTFKYQKSCVVKISCTLPSDSPVIPAISLTERRLSSEITSLTPYAPSEILLKNVYVSVGVMPLLDRQADRQTKRLFS